MHLSDFKPYSSFNVLLKGDPGTGKTPAALSFPYPTLFFDCDYRAQSLLPYFKYDKERQKNIEVVQPNHFDDVKTRLERIYSSLSDFPFKTIVLDTLTTYSDLSLRGAKMEKGGSGGRTIGTVLVPGIQDYGDEAAILNEVMTLLRLIYKKGRVNTILCAHVVTVDEKDINAGKNEQKVTYSRSLLTAGKKIGSKLPSYFDEVYHTTVEPGMGGQPKFICKMRHTGFDFARTGLECPNEIDFTNWERVPDRYFYSLIKGYMPIEEKYEENLKQEDTIERQEKIVTDKPLFS